ncbi:MAG: DUF1573 domain-containing protein [Armatimonadota bacterium]|nr:DUF1573 domain-containing protein [bacterium]
MRIYFAVALQMILIFGTMTGTCLFAAPVIEFETTSFDLGKPIEGEKAKAMFLFKNTGDTDLEITKVRAGCGCTNASATETKITPGNSAAIEAIFNTAGYPGNISKTVTVITNDPAHSSVVLKITGEVVPIAEIQPQRRLNLGNVKPGAIVLKDIVVVPKIEQRFRLVKVKSLGKRVTMLAFDKSKNKAGNYKLKIRFMAGSVLGRFNEQISIMTDLPGNPVIKCSVYGNVVSE